MCLNTRDSRPKHDRELPPFIYLFFFNPCTRILGTYLRFSDCFSPKEDHLSSLWCNNMHCLLTKHTVKLIPVCLSAILAFILKSFKNILMITIILLTAIMLNRKIMTRNVHNVPCLHDVCWQSVVYCRRWSSIFIRKGGQGSFVHRWPD